MKLSIWLFILFFQEYFTFCYCCIPVKIVIETKQWAEDIKWETYPSSEASFFGAYDDYSMYEHEYCLAPNTTFILVAYGFSGDGWHGGEFSSFILN